MKSATEDVVSIYAKMEPDAAAVEIGAMDDNARGVDTRQTQAGRGRPRSSPRMEAEKAARLTGLMTGPTGSEMKP